MATFDEKKNKFVEAKNKLSDLESLKEDADEKELPKLEKKIEKQRNIVDEAKEDVIKSLPKIIANHREDCWYREVCILPECESSCIRFNEVKFLMDSSGIPPAQQIPLSLTPEACDYDSFVRLSAIKDNIVEWVNKGSNLYICSSITGNSKTSWTLKLMLKYFDSIWSGNGFRVRGMFIHVPTFLSKLKNFNNPLPEEYKDNVMNCDLIIWDDIASTNLSQYDYSQLLTYIDSRILSRKSNIYTSNIADETQLSEAIGARLASRIYSNSEVITFYGKDWRGLQQ